MTNFTQKSVKNLLNRYIHKNYGDAFPEPLQDRDGITRWFSLHTGNGVNAVSKMVTFYLLLVEADPSKSAKSSNSTAGKKKRKAKEPKKESTRTTPEKPTIKKEEAEQRSEQKKKPDLNINLEIHISSDASEDQIDKIFESMAKHLYRD
jgi:hypothetical protein